MSNRIAIITRRRALGRIRGARFRKRQRKHAVDVRERDDVREAIEQVIAAPTDKTTRYDGQVAWDGTVLGTLVQRKYLSEAEADANDKQKINAALTRLVFEEAYHPAPTPCPHCGHVPSRCSRCGHVLTRLL